MNTVNTHFNLGGEISIHRLGFGAMRITGPGIWGAPLDRHEAIRLLQRLPELGINFIDTADSYGPHVSEELIREALHPYGEILVATKAGLTRSGPDQWSPNGRPDYLIEQAHASLRRLGVEQIGLWQLHRIDPKVPRDEQFAAVQSLLASGVIRHAGLSEVSVDDIKAASAFFKVASVQNLYNLGNRKSETVLDYCTDHGIAFIPWYPLAAGQLTQPGSLLDSIAKRHSATTGQLALAWLLHRSPVIVPIPGTSSIAHLEQNMAAANIKLSIDELRELSQIQGQLHPV